jgi:hypothetical protein
VKSVLYKSKQKIKIFKYKLVTSRIMKKRYIGLLLFLALLSSCNSSDTESGASECDQYKTVGATESCIINAAITSMDPSICRQSNSNFCYSIMWREFADESICQEIEDPETKDRCYNYIAGVEKNVEVCDKVLEQKQKDSCIISVARTTQDISLCHQISDISIKDNCLSIYYPNRNVESCIVISDEVTRDYCAINIAVEGRNYGLCDSMEQPLRDSCYLAVATNYGDTEKCNSILTPNVRNNCIDLSTSS